MNDFEDFWAEVQAFSDETGLSTSYIEEEFIIDGELIKAYPIMNLTEENPQSKLHD